MLVPFLCAALAALPADSAVLLVRVLDVSDAAIGGDAILVTDSASGRARHVLIDASDRGETVLARLAAFHVDTLAAVILSHPHADHYGGLAAVLRRLPVRAFVYGATPRAAAGYRMLLAVVDSLAIPVVVADTGVRRLTLVTGDDNATTADLLDVVQPGAVIISANGRQHPFADVLRLLAARGIPAYCTADAGTVTVRVPRGGPWTVTTERPGACQARSAPLHR